MNRIQVTGKVEMKQKAFVSDSIAGDKAKLSLTKHDKEVNAFMATLAMQVEHLKDDNLDKLFHSKTVSGVADKLVTTVTYLHFIEKNVQILQNEQATKPFVPQG